MNRPLSIENFRCFRGLNLQALSHSFLKLTLLKQVNLNVLIKYNLSNIITHYSTLKQKNK